MADQQHRLVGRRLAVLVRRLQAEREDDAGGNAEHEEVHDARKLVHQPQLEQDEPGGEHHHAGGDQRSTMRRRAQKLSHAA